jgi:hypothetical protein
MRLRRQKRTSTGRQRQPSATFGLSQSVSKLSYRSSRSDTEVKVGRQSQRQILVAAGQSARKFWLQRFGLLVLILAVIVSLVNIITLSTHANIVSLTTNQQHLIRSQTTYQVAADKLLQNSIWNHNKLTVNSSRISQEMQRQFPELDSVSVVIPLLAHRPLVYVQPAQPAVILTNQTDGAFVISTSGKTLLKSATVAGLHQPSLPVITDHSGLKLQLNHQVLSARNVSFIQQVLDQLNAQHFVVSGMTLPAAASELDVQLAGQPYQVKFNLQNNNPEQQAGTFLATIQQLQNQHVSPGQYLDVRVDGRAYYQ